MVKQTFTKEELEERDHQMWFKGVVLGAIVAGAIAIITIIYA